MGNRVKKTRAFGWFTENELAVLFGWKSASAFRKTWRARLPESAVKSEGRTNLYWAAKLHELIVEARISQEIERAGGDPDLIGGDSPALERLRAAKADVAEMQRDTMRNALYDAQTVDAKIEEMFGKLKRAADNFCDADKARFMAAVDS